MRYVEKFRLLAVVVGLTCLVASVPEIREVTDPTGLWPWRMGKDEVKILPYPYEDIVPGGWEALLKKLNGEMHDLDRVIISPAILRFVLHEGRLPESLKELLCGPYSAVRCTDLVHPILRKKFSELTGTEPLYEDYILRDTKYGRGLVYSVIVRDPTTHELVRFVDLEDKPMLLKNFWHGSPIKPIQIRKGAVPDAVIAAQAVMESLTLAENMSLGRITSFPALVERFPFLAYLRNEFNGGHAKLYAEIESFVSFAFMGCPLGDFVLARGKDGRLLFSVCGPDGWLVDYVLQLGKDDWFVRSPE